MPLRRSQEVTRSHDAAEAQLELAAGQAGQGPGRADADRGRRAGLEAAEQIGEKADKGVDLAETGNDQIHVVELLIEVKKQTVEEARRGLEAAEHDLEYTQIRARFPAWSSSATASRRFRLGGRGQF